MQIYPKYIYKDLRFHPYSTIHAIACSTETVGLQGSNPQPAAARPDRPKGTSTVGLGAALPWQPDCTAGQVGLGAAGSASQSRSRLNGNIHSDCRCIMMNEMILQGLETPLLSYRRSAASAGQPAPSDGDRLGLSASDCPAAATLTPRPVSQTSDFTESQPGPPGAGAGTRSGPRLRAAAKFPSWP